MLCSHGAEMNPMKHFQLSATHFSLCVVNKLIKIVHMSVKIEAQQKTQYDPALWGRVRHIYALLLAIMCSTVVECLSLIAFVWQFFADTQRISESVVNDN